MILNNRQPTQKLPLPRLRSVLLTILKELAIPDSDLDVTFVDDPTIRRYNRKFRGKDRATDVLSFPLWEPSEAKRNGIFLGDILISTPTAKRQARERGEEWLGEVVFLLIHGTLHLLGYDHEKTLKEAKIMRGLEKKLMKKLKSRFSWLKNRS